MWSNYKIVNEFAELDVGGKLTSEGASISASFSATVAVNAVWTKTTDISDQNIYSIINSYILSALSSS